MEDERTGINQLDKPELFHGSNSVESGLSTDSTGSEGESSSLLSSKLTVIFADTSEDSLQSQLFTDSGEFEESVVEEEVAVVAQKNIDLNLKSVEPYQQNNGLNAEVVHSNQEFRVDKIFLENLVQTLCAKIEENKNELCTQINSKMEENRIRLEALKLNNESLNTKIDKNNAKITENNQNSKQINQKIDCANNELRQVRREIEFSNRKVKEVEEMMKSIVSNLETVEQRMQQFINDIEIIKARMISTEEQIKEELKKVIIDLGQIDKLKINIDMLAKELEKRIDDEKVNIRKEIQLQKEEADKKIELVVENMGTRMEDFMAETLQIREDLCNQVNEKEVLNKTDAQLMQNEIRCTLSRDKQEQEAMIKKMSEDILKKVLEMSNINQANTSRVEVQQDMYWFQNAVQNSQLTQKLNQYGSMETLASEIDVIPPRNRGKPENIFSQQPENFGYSTSREQNNFDNHRRVVTGGTHNNYDRQDSPDSYVAYSYQNFDEIEKRESARLSRHMKQENAPTFNGRNITAPQFIADAEAFFKSIDIRHDKIKLRAMLNFLKESPLDWWKMTVGHTSSWLSFREKFLIQYFGDYEIQKMESEWMNLICKPHWNVEKFALKALKMQEILKRDLNIDKQCHNVIQKLPLILRDYLSLLKFDSGTDFMKKLKDAMRVKDYAIPTTYRTSQKDEGIKRKYREYEDRYDNNRRYSNKNKDSNTYYNRERRGYDNRPDYKKSPYYRNTGGYYSDSDQRGNSRGSDNSYHDERNYRKYDQDRGYKRRKYNDSYRDRYDNRNNKGQDRDDNKDRYDKNDDDNRARNNKRKDDNYNRRDDEYKNRDSDNYEREDNDRRNRARRENSPNIKDHTRKQAYKDQKDTYPNNRRSVRGRGIRGINTEKEEDYKSENEESNQVSEND